MDTSFLASKALSSHALAKFLHYTVRPGFLSVLLNSYVVMVLLFVLVSCYYALKSRACSHAFALLCILCLCFFMLPCSCSYVITLLRSHVVMFWCSYYAARCENVTSECRSSCFFGASIFNFPVLLLLCTFVWEAYQRRRETVPSRFSASCVRGALFMCTLFPQSIN